MCNDLQGGVSIDYTDVRFKGKVCKGPGPTEYTLPDDLFEDTPRKIRSHPGTWRGPAGKLWLVRPPRPMMTTGLSVPSKRDVGGYDYDERGVLVKNPVIVLQPTDFYEVPRGEANFTTLRYKGNFWSRMKGRDDGRISVTPGPGDYEHETKKGPSQICDERIREARRAAAKRPRFLEALYQQKLRQPGGGRLYIYESPYEICPPAKGFPAPNHYEPPRSAFDKYKRIACKCDPSVIEPPPFDQTTERFEENLQSGTPAPNAYVVADRQTCYGSILRAPFGTISARFKKRIEEIAPGPADHHTDFGNLAYESEKRFKSYRGQMIDYLSFHKALATMSDDDERTLFDEREVADERKCPVYHAVFKSTVDRLPGIRKDADGSDPGAYEALSAFKVNRDRCDFLCRRLAPPFGLRASRFPAIPEGVNLQVPGPQHYDLRGDISKDVKGGVIRHAPREREDVKGPGPAHYHIHPYVASSVLKKSFNVTLGTESKIARSIEQAQKNLRHRRRSKKYLRRTAVPRKKCISV